MLGCPKLIRPAGHYRLDGARGREIVEISTFLLLFLGDIESFFQLFYILLGYTRRIVLLGLLLQYSVRHLRQPYIIFQRHLKVDITFLDKCIILSLERIHIF